MWGPFLIALGAGSVTWIGALIVRWICNRPVDHEEYSPEELEMELEAAFVEREDFGICTTQEYLPILLEKIHQSVDVGFPESQVAAILHRAANQRPRTHRSAIFPIRIGDVFSDLELQWVRPDRDDIHLLVTAVPALINELREEAKQIPAATTS
jgi:hypothetical protein